MGDLTIHHTCMLHNACSKLIFLNKNVCKLTWISHEVTVSELTKWLNTSSILHCYIGTLKDYNQSEKA